MRDDINDQVRQMVHDAVTTTPVYDLHTHLYPPTFGSLMLWGVDELLTYHYLAAEMLRAAPHVSYDSFWAMPKPQQAELVWRTLFVDRPPVSEACRGVVTVLSRLGLQPSAGTRLDDVRAFYRQFTPQQFTDDVLRLANVRTVVMTNDPFDPTERQLWQRGVDVDPRFRGVLRVDPVLLGWPDVAAPLRGLGYDVSAELDDGTLREVRRFLTDWARRVNAIYVAASLPPTWRHPDAGLTGRVLEECVLPVCRELDLPLAVMVGVTRQVNPRLKVAGDSLGRADVSSLERLLAAHPDNRVLATFLSRENQHELAVCARKFRNLLPFGCWWFLNNPSLIEEITAMRVELLGTSFVPQHSDARVTDQLIYKWDHSRRVIGDVLTRKFTDLAAAGWQVSADEIRRAVGSYLGGTFEAFLAGRRIVGPDWAGGDGNATRTVVT